MNLKIKSNRDLYRGVSDFKKGCQARTNIVKDEKGDWVTASHSIVARWRNLFCQLLNVHGVNDVKQMEIHTAEPLLPDPSAFEFELAVEKLKRHKLPSIDQIPAALIKARGRTICSKIHKLLRLFGIRRNYQRSGRYCSLYKSVRRLIKWTVVIIESYHFCQLCTQFYPAS